MKNPNFHDVELLSALLDGKLSQAEAAKLESRLRTEPNLKAVLEDLTETRSLLRRLPRRRAPRNFTLTPQMAGVKPPTPRAVPTLRFATMLATFLLVFSLATNALAPALRQAVQAPVYGMGGGGGGAADSQLQESAPATEPPAATLLPPAAAALPTLEAPTLEQNRILPTPTPEPFLKEFSQPEQPLREAQPAPIQSVWLIALLVIALLSGGLAWLINRASERSWRAKMK